MTPNAAAPSLGLFGGSFDPFHEGHLAIARAARDELSLDRVVLMVARMSPLKEQTGAPAADRLAMARLAAEGEAKIVVNDLELSRPGPSFTIDTVSELRAASPNTNIFLIVGSDSLAMFPKWREVRKLVTLADLVVAPRGGVGMEVLQNPEFLQIMDGRKATWLRMAMHPASSTEIRERLASGAGGRWLRPSVEQYILQKKLYQKPGARC